MPPPCLHYFSTDGDRDGDRDGDGDIDGDGNEKRAGLASCRQDCADFLRAQFGG